MAQGGSDAGGPGQPQDGEDEVAQAGQPPCGSREYATRGFALGACGGLAKILMPSAWNTVSKEAVNLCRSKIGFCVVSCVFLEFMRLGRTR